MSARDNILKRIRAANRRPEEPIGPEREVVLERLRTHWRGPLPTVAGSLIPRFRERCAAMLSTVDQVESLADAPAAIVRYLREHGLPLSAACWPAFAQLDWARAGLSVQARPAEGEDKVGISGAYCAVAETGTLMLCATRDTPATLSLLPETHIAIVPVRRIVAYMEDGWELARAELGQLPRAVNFISGPSRTADIEQTIVVGAHGPYRVHVILVD